MSSHEKETSPETGAPRYSDPALNDEYAYYQRITEVQNDEIGNQLLRHIDVLNAKAGSLLAHVSVMAAAVAMTLTIPASTDIGNWIKVALVFEMVVYISISLFTLRSSFMTSSDSFTRHHGKNVELILKITRQRRRVHNAMNKITIIVTIIFSFTLFAKAVTFFIQ